MQNDLLGAVPFFAWGKEWRSSSGDHRYHHPRNLTASATSLSKW